MFCIVKPGSTGQEVMLKSKREKYGSELSRAMRGAMVKLVAPYTSVTLRTLLLSAAHECSRPCRNESEDQDVLAEVNEPRPE